MKRLELRQRLTPFLRSLIPTWMFVVTVLVPSARLVSAEPATATARTVADLLTATTPQEPLQSCMPEAPTSQSPLSPLMLAASSQGGVLAGGAGGLWVQCSLPYTQGRPGGDCTGKHAMQWQVLNGPGAKVTAELMALDTNGNLLHGFQVQRGENVQLASRLNRGAWRFRKGNNGTYDLFAPVGLLKVTAEYNGDRAEAYCTAVPYLDVVQPSGGVVSSSGDGASVEFRAAAPRNDPNQLELKLDGIDLLPLIAAAEGGLHTCRWDSPCEGTLVAPAVTYKNLIIDVATNIGQMASNTISGRLEGLDCGGHVLRVNGGEAADFRRTTPQCYLDDLTDRGSASIFTVDVTKIADIDVFPGLVTSQVPTKVNGLICAGANIVKADVNGKVLSVAGQAAVNKGVTPDGDPIGLQVTLVIDTALPQTDLRADLDGTTTSLGTFHQGSNRLVASAMEGSKGARAHDTHIFAVGNNIKPLGVDPGAAIVSPQALSAAVNANVQSALQAKMNMVMNAPTSTSVRNAFVLGLSAEGAQTIINSLCVDPLPGDGRTLGQIFKATVEDVLDDFTFNAPLTTFTFPPPCSCNTDVRVFIEEVEAGTDFACPLTFEDNQIKATLELPDVRVKVRAIGPKNECIIVFPNLIPPFIPPVIPLPTHTEVNAFAEVSLQNITFSYTITENDLLQNDTTVGPNPFVVGGELPIAAGGAFSGNRGVDYGVGGDLCNFFLDTFVTVLTFGQVDIGPLLNLQFDIHETINLTEVLRPTQGGATALPLPAVRVQEQVVEPYHQKISGEISLLSDIQITGPTNPNAGLSGAGITIGLTGSFATTKLDLGVEGNPGVETFEPNLPTMAQMQQQGAVDATVGLSSDAINMLFASLAGGGDMKVPNSDEQGCFLGANVGQVLPANCDSLELPGLTGLALEAVATVRGICHGIRGNTDCDTLVYNNPANNDPSDGLSRILTGTVRGVCHGVKRDGSPDGPEPDPWCAFVAPDFDLVELASCFAAEALNINLTAQSNVMFCAKGDIPVMSFPNNPSINGVASDLALNDISVSLVVDRDGNGTVDGPINSLPGCFSGQQTTSDCNVVAACLDVNFRFAAQNVICDAGTTAPKPGFQFAFLDFLPVIRDIGKVCSPQQSTQPATPSSDGQVLEASSDRDRLTQPLATNAAVLSPPICGAGLDMGGFVTCANAQILGLEANGDPKFKEFLALTCDLQ